MSLDLSAAWETVRRMLNGFAAALPRVVLGLVVVVLFFLVAKGVRALIRRNAQRRGEHRTLELAIGRLAQVAILVVGVLIAVTAAFPSFTPANLVSTLGIGGVAIGFAFKDIFQNFLAGLLILVTRPFRVGDQIRYKDYEGTVEDIQTRATYLKTYDGRRVIIPNGELYTNSVTVNTAFSRRRWQYDVGIGYGDDVERARTIILDALQQAQDVEPDPKADVIVVELAGSSVNLRARWWTKSPMGDGLAAQDRVLTAVKQALTAAGIDLPFPTRQILFHDQTEATDGDRGRQREGWPAGEGEVPEARGIAAALLARHDARGDGANGGARVGR
ncbi:mechanosensitive ion channel family protein [Roseisolibacter sp. H3M3-2]|uniref:mechanosensitive ion channel family protein n=1 Tax=Roseisolibacter sp. H3M3-2 TaxID=3031323 RepID=UPI0023DC8509|nr:mechanosensitive ion channel family protein [Roseisolibacter sp. H3M3-2]MDF1501345.1 mechanosensitive ion channel family protein [Roseisolibacter sp. H3M3-2]